MRRTSSYLLSGILPGILVSAAIADSVQAQTYDMKWPVTGRATSRVGPRNGRMHSGRDIACSYVSVRAAYGGTVTRLGNDVNGYGLYIDVAHAAGYMTRYAHLSKYGAKLNQAVSLGQIIATSGNTGNSTGPHIHFEVRRYGVVQTPYWDAKIALTTHKYTEFIPFDFPGLGGPTLGKLRGVLYDAVKGTSARVAGATVALSDGRFTTTSSTGAFSFALKAGTYSYAATAPGFHANSLKRTVPSTGEIWGSIGLRTGPVPAMTANAAPTAGALLGIRVRGDAGSTILMMVNTRPQIPLFDMRNGWGVFWPRINGSVVVTLGRVPSGGTYASPLRAPANSRGVRAHLQSLVRWKGKWRLTNGIGILVR